MQSFIRAPHIGGQLALSIVCSIASYHLWPSQSYQAQWWHYALSGLLGYLAVKLLFSAFFQIIHYHHQINLRNRSKQPPISEQGARFATEREMAARGLFNPNNGIPIGQFNGRPLFFDFIHALCLAPAGSGKTTSLALPALAHGYRNKKHKTFPSGCYSAIVVDLKPELKAMSWRLRRKKYNHRIITIDFSDPNSDSYNPLDLIIDALLGRVPITKALTFTEELVLILEPEPSDGDGKNKYFRDGSRKVLMVVILFVCLSDPDNATLTKVRSLIMDGKALINLLGEAAKMDALNGEVALMAADLLSEDKHFFEFRSSASMTLRPYSSAGELAHVVKKSTFRFSELKSVPTTVYIIANLGQNKALKQGIEVLTERAMSELSLSTGNIPVYIQLDEATNFSLDISEKLTALRSFGVRMHAIAQEYSEMEKVFGKHSAETIFNECDLKNFFAVSDPYLAKKLSEMMGNRLVVRQSYNLGDTHWEDIKASSHYEKIPLMSAQEIMDMPSNEQLIFINGFKPIHCNKLRYDEVSPWLSWLDDNPQEGGKLPGPSHIFLRYTKKGVRVGACRKRTAQKHTQNPTSQSPIPLWLSFTGFWLGVFYVAWESLT